jgi:predicted GTPase
VPDYTSGDLLIIEKCRKLKHMIKDLRLEEKGHKHQAKACREKREAYESEIEDLLGVTAGNAHSDPAQTRLPVGDRT